MATVTYYPITFSDGQVNQIGVFFPDSYAVGVPQKWSIFLHPGGTGPVAHTFAQYADSYRNAANKYNMIFMSFSGQGNTGGGDWVNTDLTPNFHLEDAVAWARATLGLTDYLPCLIGVSMGGGKAIFEMVHNPLSYSAFASAVPAANLKLFYATQVAPSAYIPEVGGYFDSTDPTIVARWDRISPSKFLGIADLKGRKIFVTFAADDATIPRSVYDEVLANLPPGNSHGVILVAGATHTSATNDPYMDTIFSNFNAESRLMPIPIPSTNIPFRIKVAEYLREYSNGYVKVGLDLRSIVKIFVKVGSDLRE